MRVAARIAGLYLGLLFCTALLANFIAPHSYSKQYREFPNHGPSREFLLGTDPLGRDRLSRLIHGTRTSVALAPAAAAVTSLLAAALGAVAGWYGGWFQKFTLAGIDLVLSLPWLFLLLTARAALPLNVSPLASVLITFALLALLGWAPAARSVSAAVKSLLHADAILQARACGSRGLRLFAVHLLPNLKPIVYAQFWVAVPLFILSEANLGFLGLGVAQPQPSWGNLLAELQDFPAVAENPLMLAPLAVLVSAMGSLQLILRKEASAP